MHYSLRQGVFMKRCILLIFFALCLSGCGGGEIKTEFKEKNYSAPGYSARLQCPVIHDNSDFAKELNRSSAQLCDTMLGNFLAEAERSLTDRDSLCLKWRTALSQNGILSLVGECEAFCGGVHPNLSRIVYNLDIKNARKISLADLFADSGYISRINSYIEAEAERRPEDFCDLWKKPTMSAEREFYLSPKGVVIYFPPYELSYYSKGFVEIEIPFEELSGYLNPEYAERFE